MKKCILLLVSIVVYCAQSNGMDVISPVEALFSAIKCRNNKDVLNIIRTYPEVVSNYSQYDDDSRVLFGEVTPLHVAVHKDNHEAVMVLLAAGASPCSKTRSLSCPDAAPLHYVCSVRIVNLLMANGAQVDEKDRHGRSPLFLALFHPWRFANFEVAQCFVDHGADVNEHDGGYFAETLLHKAISEYGCVMDRVKFLLKNKLIGMQGRVMEKLHMIM